MAFMQFTAQSNLPKWSAASEPRVRTDDGLFCGPRVIGVDAPAPSPQERLEQSKGIDKLEQIAYYLYRNSVGHQRYSL